MVAPNAALPTLALIGQEIILGIVLTLWLDNRSHTGFALAGVSLYLTYLWRAGFNIHNPLLAYPTPPEQGEALYMYNAIYPTIILVSLFVGYMVCLIVDIRPLVWPGDLLTRWFDRLNNPPIADTDEGVPEEDYDAVLSYDALQETITYTAGPGQLFRSVQPYYWHNVVGILLLGWTQVAPQLLFVFLYENAWQKWVMLAIGTVLKITGYIIGWVFWSFRTALNIWGPSRWNIEQRSVDKELTDEDRADDPETNESIYKHTQSVITRNVLTIALIDILGWLLIGFVIVIPSTADVRYVWVFGLIFGLIVLAAILIYLVFAYLAQVKRDKMAAAADGRIYSARSVRNTTPYNAQVHNSMTGTALNAKQTKTGILKALPSLLTVYNKQVSKQQKKQR